MRRHLARKNHFSGAFGRTELLGRDAVGPTNTSDNIRRSYEGLDRHGGFDHRIQQLLRRRRLLGSSHRHQLVESSLELADTALNLLRQGEKNLLRNLGLLVGGLS